MPSLLSLDPHSILVDRDSRQRRDLDTQDLEDSIRQYGQLQPIVIETLSSGAHRLIAGERRLSSCRNLGLPILAIDRSELSQIELQIIELEENIKRQGLCWQDESAAVARIHQLYCEKDPDWTLGETSRATGINISTISIFVRLTKELAELPQLAECTSWREAYNKLQRRDARGAAEALEELTAPIRQQPPAPVTAISPGTANPPSIATGPATSAATAIIPPAQPAPLPIPPPPPPGPPSATETLLHTSFLSFAPSYTGPKFNFIHCDFPYGIDVFSGPQGRGAEPTAGYDDQKDVYWTLVSALLDNINSLAALSCHVLFWYSEQHGPRTRELFDAAGFRVQTHPLIWLKTDNAGISPDPKRKPRHVYETALLMTRGDRQIVKIKADGYAAPTAKHLHPSCKPAPVLKHFFEMLVDDHTVMLDPTCGSATSIQAAEHWGAKLTLGLEQNLEFLTPARHELQKFRNLRGASKLGL